MLDRRLIVASVSCACLSSLIGCAAPEACGYPHRTEAEVERSGEHAVRIGKEIEDLRKNPNAEPGWAKEWAGIYFGSQSGWTGFHYSLTPRAGVCWDWGACTMKNTNYAAITGHDAEGVEVRWALSRESEPKRERLHFVRWGERRYLIPESELIALVNYYNEGLRPDERSSASSARPSFQIQEFACRIEDRSKPVTGRPQLPASWASLLRDEPIRATVAAVRIEKRIFPGGHEYDAAIVTLRGSAVDGLYEGLELYGEDVMRPFPVVAMKVGDGEATGEEIVLPRIRPIPVVGEVVRNRVNK